MGGLLLQTDSEDAGYRRSLVDVVGNPVRRWNERGFGMRMVYDALLRPTDVFVTPPSSAEILVPETTIAGMQTAAAASLEAEVFTTVVQYDALSRPTQQTTPDDSRTELTYNEAGLLEAVDVALRGAANSSAYVTDIDYDAKGQRERVVYANGVTTTYAYDPLTFRLSQLRSTRASDSAVLQDLRYTYDPVGNITQIRDLAQQTVFFDNAVVSPDQLFEYDPLYRLTSATGREHTSLGQTSDVQVVVGPQPHPDDPAALRTYTQNYEYDPVGNILRMVHTASGGNWTRGYDYEGAGNRLRATSLPGDTVADPQTYSATYTHDDHGNMTAMPHLTAIVWDHADRMQHCDLGGGGDVWFVYDAAGNRVRKVKVSQSGTTITERIYLGGYELYRQHVSGTLQTERQSLHVADDTGRICLVETLTVEGGTPVASPTSVQRYQHSNHLGTAVLEVDETAAIISYEEYHPFGTSGYRAADSSIEVSPKRYRYIGKERDEQTGLYHMGARYYAGWLGRWTAADPAGLVDGPGRYSYARDNPVRWVDRQGMRARPASDPGPDRSPFYEQEFRVQQARQEVENIRGLISDLDLERQGGEDIEGLDAEIAGLQSELAAVESEVKFEAAVLDVAKAGSFEEARASLKTSGVSPDDFGKVTQRAGSLRLQERVFATSRQSVARAPTAAERGQAIREQQRQARWQALEFSVAALSGIEALAAARVGLVAVEARLAAASSSGRAAASEISTASGGHGAKELYHYTDEAAATAVNETGGLKASAPETLWSVNREGVHDAGLFNPATGMGNRSTTPNVFFTDVPPAAMSPEVAQGMGIRSTESVFRVEREALEKAGIPVHQNPSHPDIYNAVTEWVSSTFFR